MIPTGTGSTPQFFVQKTVKKTPEPVVSTPESVAETPIAAVASVQEKKIGEYEPLKELPKKKGFWARLWSWIKGLFT